MAAAREIRRAVQGRIARDGVVLSQSERNRRIVQAMAADPAGSLRVEVSALQDEVRYLDRLLTDAEKRLKDARTRLRRAQGIETPSPMPSPTATWHQ